MNKEIGGFFELELDRREKYHKKAIKLNSARYCLQYILKVKKYRKIYVPYYICDCILQPIVEENLEYEFYSINNKFEPIFNKKISEDECFLYVNYFGINSKSVNKVRHSFRNLIIDNTQAFFELPLLETDTIYSARKFFGVPDGGYLYIDKILDCEIKQDISYDRFSHLLKRVDTSANESYELFRKSEESLNNCGMKKMSQLTQSILANINYENAKCKRNTNFMYLHDKLNKYNELKFDMSYINGPMVYPLLVKDNALRQKFIDNKIYVATYWSEVRDIVSKDSFEYLLTENLLPLPIDQRYGREEMVYIMKILSSRWKV